MLCAVCLGVFQDPELLAHGTNEFEHIIYLLPHHHSVSSLQASAQLKCTICCQLWDMSIVVLNCSTESQVKLNPPSNNVAPFFVTFRSKDSVNGDTDIGEVSYTLEPCTGE